MKIYSQIKIHVHFFRKEFPVTIGKEAALYQAFRQICRFLTFRNGNFYSTVSLPNALIVPYYGKILSIEDKYRNRKRYGK